MIKKIRSSLFIKVFLLTMGILVLISMVVYMVLAWYTPHMYSNTLNESLDTQVKAFVSRLEETARDDSGGLFDQFVQDQNISYIELYRDDGTRIEIPSRQSENHTAEFLEAVTEETTAFSVDTVPILRNNYFFCFSDSDAVYNLVVYGNAAQIMELKQAFIRILPVLSVVIIIVSFLVSFLFSYLITKPVLKISRIAKEMSDLKLDWEIKEKRFDELGVLENSLNEMSRKLLLSIQELETANRKLEKDIEHEKRLEQERINFFSAVSHELKTPITVIKGQLEGMLLGIGVYKERDKYLARSLEVADTLEKMVQEILTVSRLESIEEIVTERIDMIPFIYKYIGESEDIIAQKELEIEISVPDRAYVNCNRLLMEKVFTNLLGNAMKYSPQGAGVAVFIGKREGKWNVCVENTGVHIEEKELSKLFQAFYRVEQSRNRKTGGSGLGLYITQRILERYGSECKAANTEAGVKFFFTISCAE